MDYLPQLFVLGVAVLAAWLILRRHAVFTIRIQNGQPKLGRGKVAAVFLGEVQNFCQEHGISSGTIYGIRKGPHITLAFSRHIPKGCQQQLRNLWALAR